MGQGFCLFFVFHVIFWFLVLVPMFVLVFVLLLFVSSISSVHCRNSKLGCFFKRVSPFRSLNSIKLQWPTSQRRQESVESCRMLWPSKANRVNRNNVTLRSWEIWRGACAWPVSSGSVSPVKQFSVHVSKWTNHFWRRRESAGEQVCSWLIIFL